MSFEEGINVFLRDIVLDGLTDLKDMQVTWKLQYLGVFCFFSILCVLFAFLSITGSDTIKRISMILFWISFTMVIMYPFLYWVDTSGFLSGLAFFVYFVVTYIALGGGKGRTSILANLVAATMLFGAIMWYYTWDMTILWLKTVGLWLFLFNTFCFGGFKSAIEGEDSKMKLVGLGVFITAFFVIVIFFGFEYVNTDVANDHWDGVKPIWR